MNNIQFKNYLDEQLKDLELKEEFDKEILKLKSVIAVSEIWKSKGPS